MKDKIISYLREKGFLVTPEALEEIMKEDAPLTFAERLSEEVSGSIIDVEQIEQVRRPKEEKKVVYEPSSPFNPPAKEIESKVVVFDEHDVTGKSLSEGKVEDFIDYFRDRFRRLSKILKERSGTLVKNIEALKKKQYADEIRIIGMISSLHETKKGHVLMTLEDETDQINVLIPKQNRDLMLFSKNLLPDEVVAVEGVLRGTLFIAQDIFRPDIPMKTPNRADEEVYVVMISDTHVGSKLFMEKNFVRFIDWLNGRYGDAKQRELAGRVKYITFAGDLCDGVGIYPGQEDELETDDIFKQYDKLAMLLENVPDYIEIIAISGNHDAVRVADPQPAIPEYVLGHLKDLPNFRSLGSPSYVSLHGVEFLLYHGHSIHSVVPHVSTVDYKNPEMIVKEYLQRRHLHPVYGEKPPICPEKKDYLVIERVPDVVQVADVHKNGYMTYKGVIGVNAGCWQNTTPYQIKQGHHPTPCILPVMNLQTGKLNILHFDR